MRIWLSKLAAGAPVPVFAAPAPGAESAVELLRLHPGLRFVDSPRAANVLLVVGDVSHAIFRPVLAIHDQLSHPRVTVWWLLDGGGERLSRLFPDVVRCESSPFDTDAPVAAIREAHEALLRGEAESEPPVLPDEDPAPWRGVGPYGQGGKGMTGGVPYGRPLAGRASARDGLELDVLPLRIGPFFPPFPSGLALDVRLQGDVVQEARVVAAPAMRPGSGAVVLDPFHRALTESVRIAELEEARARHHLRWFAGLLRVHGLPALSQRALRLATARELSSTAVGRLRSLVEGLRSLVWATRGVGVVPPGRIAGAWLGPVARSAGVVEDVRAEDAAYVELGFTPVVMTGADACARWRQRMAEAVQALDLARAARELVAGGRGVIESPRGRLAADDDPSSRMLGLLPDLLTGLEWGDAVATVASLDLGVAPAPRDGTRDAPEAA